MAKFRFPWDDKGNFVEVEARTRGTLADVRNGTGPAAPYRSPEEAGGYPPIEPGTACLDSDHEGMPDAWEKRRGLNPRDPSDGPKDRDGNGYTSTSKST